MTTDISEKGLEALIARAMTGHIDLLSPPYVASETSPVVPAGSSATRSTTTAAPASTSSISAAS